MVGSLPDSSDFSLETTRQEVALAAYPPGSGLGRPFALALDRFDRVVSLGHSYLVIPDTRIRHLLVQPRLPGIYDKELFTLLLRLFHVHVAPAFTSFAGVQVSEDTPPELVLAMAAVGATFSGLDEGQVVGCSLYTHAQRMSLDTVFGSTPDIFKDLWTHIQTVMLLELFGMCSTHKRSSELAEGYHPHLCQSLERLIYMSRQQKQTTGSAQDPLLLIRDTLMLECYRTLIWQKRPSLILSSLSDVPVPQEVDDSSTNTIQLHQIDLLEATSSEKRHRPTLFNISCLYTLSHRFCGSYSIECYEAKDRLWSVETICTAFAKLASGSESDADRNNAALCHAIIMILCAPIDELREILYLMITSQEIPSNLARALQNWRRSSDCVIAVEHAEAILNIAEQKLLNHPFGMTNDAYNEMPHDAWCIYLAALVLWRRPHGLDDEHRSTCRSALQIAIRLLGGLRVAVASKMLLVLKALDKDEA